ncbi:MAG TPA: hypothetical protein VHC63_00970 [Acidimicrobiales bacterium]|nr:hypothetical protein [Acidimicrobiales bacterium]
MRRHVAILVALVAAALGIVGSAAVSELAVASPVSSSMHAGVFTEQRAAHMIGAATEPSAVASLARPARRDVDVASPKVAALFAAGLRGTGPANDLLATALTPSIQVRRLLANDVAGRAPPVR